MSQAIKSYVNALFNTLNQAPELQQSCYTYCEKYKDIYTWLANSPLRDDENFLSRLKGVLKPRELQTSLQNLEEPSSKKPSNMVRIIVPQVLPEETTSRLLEQADLTKLQADFEAIKKRTFSDLENYNLSHLIAKKKNKQQALWQTGHAISHIEEFHREIKSHLQLKSKKQQSINEEQPLNPHTITTAISLTEQAKLVLNNQTHADAPSFLSAKLKNEQLYFPHAEVMPDHLSVSVTLKDISIICFATGVKLCVLSFSYNHLIADFNGKPTIYPLTVEDMANINEHFTNMHQGDKIMQMFSNEHGSSGVHWMEILTGLLGLPEVFEKNHKMNCSALRAAWEVTQPFVYTTVILGRDENDTRQHLDNRYKIGYLNELQSKLTFKENVEYYMRDKSTITTLGESDIRHQFSRQGGSTILNPNRLMTYKKQFFEDFNSRKENTYFAISLVAYAEYFFLITMQNRVQMNAFDELNQSLLDKIIDQYQLLTSHRINHRFAEISHIEAHNQAYESWDKVFRITKLHQYLGEDIQDYRNVIEFHHNEKMQALAHAQAEQEKAQFALEQEREKAQIQREKKHDRLIKNIAKIGTALVFLSGIFGTNFEEMTSLYSGDPIRFLSSDWHAIVIGLVIIVTTWFVSFENNQANADSQSRSRFYKLVCYLVGLSCIFIWGNEPLGNWSNQFINWLSH